MLAPQPFRVLLSAYACQPGLGSEPGLGWNWALELARAGASVWVLTSPKGKAEIESFLRDHRDLDLHFIYVEQPPLGWVLRRLPRGRYWQYVRWQESAYEAARELQARVHFDIAHHVSFASLLIGSRLWRLESPFIFGPVGGGQTAPPGFRRHLQGGWVFESLRTIVVRHLYAHILNARSTVRGATLVLAANRETEAAVRALGANEMRAMSGVGLAPEHISARSPVGRSREEPLRILWVARLLPFKGLLLALEAMALIDRTTPWKLTIAGDGPQGKMLPHWVEALGLRGKVEWLGSIPFAQVQAMYDRADLFLFTSLRDTEGSQLLEAMARGVPILTLDHQGAATLVPDAAGIKVPISTPSSTAFALARAVERLAADRAALLRMGEAALEVARRHTWDRKAQDALRIYKQLVERRVAS